jgi:uncharacterized protein (UPF0332 family)
VTKGDKKHPPKKKHPNRPRSEPVIPLTDDARQALAAKEFRKAEMHLSEAEALSKIAVAPNACAHAAYYAMYHCAAAYILAAGGVGKRKDFPASHTHVIEHFGKLTVNEGGALADAGPMLSRAQTDRDVADYDLIETIAQKDAAETAAEARKFLDACDAKWRFRSAISKRAKE